MRRQILVNRMLLGMLLVGKLLVGMLLFGMLVRMVYLLVKNLLVYLDVLLAASQRRKIRHLVTTRPTQNGPNLSGGCLQDQNNQNNQNSRYVFSADPPEN